MKPASPRTTALARIRAVVANLPEVVETMAWGHPNWRAGGAKGRIFMSFEGQGAGAVCFRLEPSARERLLADDRFSIPPHGGATWVSLDLAPRPDWREIARLARASHAFAAQPEPRRIRKRPLG